MTEQSETLEKSKKDLKHKVKSLQQTIDLQMELIETLQEQNASLLKENNKLKKRLERNV